MTGKRKRYSADFKAKVALEALRGDAVAELRFAPLNERRFEQWCEEARRLNLWTLAAPRTRNPYRSR